MPYISISSIVVTDTILLPTGILMNKSELIDVLKNENGMSKNDAAAAVNLIFDEMSSVLADGDRIEFRGLCSIYIKKYGPYTGRNPKTGEKVKIRSKRLPFFKAGKELKERVDN